MIEKIRAEMEGLADAEQAAFLSRYFKTGPGEYGEGDVFRGIRVPVTRSLAKKYKVVSLSEAELLLHSRFHEDRLLALFLLVGMYPKSSGKAREDIFRLYLNNTRFINNWDLVDSSAEHIVGAFLFDKERGLLVQLAHSEILWERRIAIMSTFHYIKKQLFDDTLRIARILLRDPEDLIHKAVGWMLREIGKRDTAAEENFLMAYYREMPRTMLRYAIEKLPEARRQAYLKGTVE